MSRSGKIFTMGLMLMYLAAASTALIILTSNIGSEMPPNHLGTYQAGLLDAYARADRKLGYLEGAAELALQRATDRLYRDPDAFFTQVQGDLTVSLGCGSYGYLLWNDNQQGCLVGDGLGQAQQRILDALTPVTIQFLTQETLAYPAGGFTEDYSLTPVTKNGVLSVRFSGPPLAEPLLVGLTATAPATAPAQIGEQVTQTTQARVSGLPIQGPITVTSCFGYRSSGSHRGIDLRASGDVIAAADGTVIKIGDVYLNSNGGKYLLIKDDGFYTRYMHLDPSSITVKPGDFVKAGQVIGTPGQHLVVPPHLHFEVWVPQQPQGGTYFADPSLGYAINPACLYTADVIGTANLKDASDDACRSQGADAPRGWCGQYGIDLSPITRQLAPTTPATGKPATPSATPTTTPPPAATQSPSAPPATGTGPSSVPSTPSPSASPQGTTSLQPATAGLDDKTSSKLLKTMQNMQTYGWGQYVFQDATPDVPASLILGFITQESTGDPYLVGNGDVGLMQINDGTAPGLVSVLKGSVPCGCTNTRAVPGSSCTCTVENDGRLRPQDAVPAAVKLISDNARLFAGKTDRLKFTIAAYNTGGGRISGAVRALGGDPSWDQVVAYLRTHESASYVNTYLDGVVRYVDSVTMYSTAWNKGTPVDAGYVQDVEQLHQSYGTFTYSGTYTVDPSLVVKLPDKLTPFLSLLGKADALLTQCSKADVPGDCLVSEAAKQDPAFSQSCEQPGAQYFLQLYQAIRDCAENRQFGCSCPLPLPPASSEHNYTFAIDPTARTATLLADGTPVQGLSFPNVSIDALRVIDPDRDEVVPLGVNITLSQDGKLAFVYQENNGPRVALPSFFLAKDAVLLNRTVLLPAVSSSEQCAAVKTHYLFCAAPAAGLPQVKFGLTVKDDAKPAPPTAVVEDASTGRVSFVASASKDVAFYDVYDHDPVAATTTQTALGTSLASVTRPVQASPALQSGPLLQLRTVMGFNAAAYKGKTLFLTAVDRAGNEGAAVSVVVQ